MNQVFPQEREQKRQALLDAVGQVREILAADVEEAEKLRTLPPSSVGALRDSGLLALKTPAALRGAEADPIVGGARSFVGGARSFVGGARSFVGGARSFVNGVANFSGSDLRDFAGYSR
jgi:hypothetical protein